MKKTGTMSDVIKPYEPSEDELRAEWTGDEKARERAFNNFAQRRDRNPTVQQKRGFGKRRNSEIVID